jgi:hypothetical protein
LVIILPVLLSFKILHSGHFLAAKLAIHKLIQKITNFQNIFLKINLFYMLQYTITSEIYSWNQISGRFRAWHGVDAMRPWWASNKLCGLQKFIW